VPEPGAGQSLRGGVGAGPRTADLAATVVQAPRVRTTGQAGITWISDGWTAYAETITDVYADPVPVASPERVWSILHPTPGLRLTQVVKSRRRRRLVRVAVQATIGTTVDQPDTVHIERFNGVMRDRLACLTRKTPAFAKDARTWDAAVGLAVFEHNWLRPHPALRVALAQPADGRRYLRRTPAMVLGLADHPWSFAEFLTRPVPHYVWG
jgi:IS1 family transposase